MRITSNHVVVVLVSVVGLWLVGTFASFVIMIRHAANRSMCISRFKQTGLGIHTSMDRNQSISANISLEGIPPERQFSWVVTILPHIEQHDMLKTLDLTEPCDSFKNDDALKKSRLTWNFICPSSSIYTRDSSQRILVPITHIIGVSGVGQDAVRLPKDHPDAGFFGYDRKMKLTDLADTSNTIMLMEPAQSPGNWWATGRATVRGMETAKPNIGLEYEFGGFHHDQAYVNPRSYNSMACMADGSVRIFTDKVDPEILANLARISRVAKEAIPESDKR